MKGKLSKLKPLHPLPDDIGEVRKHGFNADIGQGSKWITDGHSLFWRAGFNESMLVNKQTYFGKKPTPASIRKLWDDAKSRVDIRADVMGCTDCKYLDDDEDDEGKFFIQSAILRDEADRIVYVDAFKLSFMIIALAPDRLSVAKDDGEEKMIRFFRAGEQVGCLMPLRKIGGVGGNIEAGYDVDGDPLSLELVVGDGK